MRGLPLDIVEYLKRKGMKTFSLFFYNYTLLSVKYIKSIKLKINAWKRSVTINWKDVFVFTPYERKSIKIQNTLLNFDC